jgi:hypothetical protein
MKKVGMITGAAYLTSSLIPQRDDYAAGYKNGKDPGINIKPSHRGRFTKLK